MVSGYPRCKKNIPTGTGWASQQKECNTLVLSMHLTLAFHEHKHHPSIHEHEHMEFHLILYILSHVMLIIYMHMLVIMCDQCKRWLWGHKNTLDISRMVNGTMFVFMTWANFASKCWFTLNAFYMMLVWPKLNSSLDCLHCSAPLIKVVVHDMGNKLYLRVMS